MYLIKLRLYLTQAVIRILFGNPSQSKVNEVITSVSESPLRRFTPRFLGYKHLTDMQLQTSTEADGTYIFVFKSSGIHLFFIANRQFIPNSY